MERLIELDHVIGIKDSWGDFQQILFEIEICKDTDVALFCGDVGIMGPAIMFGADGGVPGPSNYYPELFVELYKAAKARDIEKIFELQQKASRIYETMGLAESWISAVKYIGAQKGLHSEFASVSAVPLTAEEKAVIDRLL